MSGGAAALPHKGQSPWKHLEKYRSFFRIQLQGGMQYRAAALGGIVTQFFWGFMQIMVYTAFYRSAAPGAFPMEMQALSSYVWLQQAFLNLFNLWSVESDIYELITSGNVAYELCRPFDLYACWFAKSAAGRVARTVLRCLPILLVAALLPAPYGLALPKSPGAFLLFLISGLLGFLVVLSISMLMYVGCFFTMSPLGVRTITNAVTELFSGAILPLPFLPNGLQAVVAFLPFASMQNLPLRIYGGDIAGREALWGIALQAFWLLLLLALGWRLMKKALSRAVVQGG